MKKGLIKILSLALVLMMFFVGGLTACSTAGESQGLSFELNEDGASYTVTGVGTFKGNQLVIPAMHEDLPVTGVSRGAFESSADLKSIVVPEGVKTIGWDAFSLCTNVTQIELPSTLEEIGVNKTFIGEKTIYGAILSGCYALKEIKVSENNPLYKTVDGSLYSKDGKTLIQYAHGRDNKEFTVPAGVENIRKEAFAKGDKLEKIIFGEDIKFVGNRAFHSSALVSVEFQKTNTYIDIGAFMLCPNLINVTLPNITEISEDMFGGCDSLETITIPESVNKIGAYAFEGCEKLLSINYKGTISKWKSMSKGNGWNDEVPATIVICSDGSFNI